jgi:hypothetical protein
MSYLPLRDSEGKFTTPIRYLAIAAVNRTHRKLHQRLTWKDAGYLWLFSVICLALYSNLTAKPTYLSPVPPLMDSKTNQVRISDIDLLGTIYNPLPKINYALVKAEDAESYNYRLPDTIEREIKAVFGNDGDDAIKVARCESGLRPQVCNDGLNSNGTVDCGVFQVNSIHGVNRKWLQDRGINIRVAFGLFKDQGWEPWRSSNKCHHMLDSKIANR